MKEKCDKNCQTCDINQRSYCTAQLALANQAHIEELKEMLSNLSPETSELISFQNNDALEITEIENNAQSEGAS